MTAKSNAKVIRLTDGDSSLTVHDGSDHVLLQDGNKHVAPRTVSALVNACRMADQAGEVSEQFRDLMEILSDWIREHRSQLQSAWVAIRSEGLLFVAVQADVPYDDELASAIADLELHISQDTQFGLLHFTTIALPKCEEVDLEQFFELDSFRHSDA